MRKTVEDLLSVAIIVLAAILFVAVIGFGRRLSLLTSQEKKLAPRNRHNNGGAPSWHREVVK